MGTTAPASPRRRFQFRLRTLLIVVTLLSIPCAYVGWQAKIVRERKTFLETFRRGYVTQRLSKDPPPTWIRGLLGDETYAVIALPLNAAMSDRELVAGLFPEAKIRAINPEYPVGMQVNGKPEPKVPRFVPFPDENR